MSSTPSIAGETSRGSTARIDLADPPDVCACMLLYARQRAATPRPTRRGRRAPAWQPHWSQHSWAAWHGSRRLIFSPLMLIRALPLTVVLSSVARDACKGRTDVDARALARRARQHVRRAPCKSNPCQGPSSVINKEFQYDAAPPAQTWRLDPSMRGILF